MESNVIDNLQTGLNRLGKWVVENEMKINPSKGTAVKFTKAKEEGKDKEIFSLSINPGGK
jgi:hypothetical protein